MAKLRKNVYKNKKQPYTRYSKFKKKNYVKSRPPHRIAQFKGGDATADYEYQVHLICKDDMQIRSNALEAARTSGNRTMLEKLGKKGFWFQVRIYPHHVLRENPLATGAGADRLSTGMKKSFGQSIGTAAQLDKRQEMFTIHIDEENIKLARKALEKAAHKLPCKTRIKVEENEKDKQ